MALGDDQGNIIYSENMDSLFVPASILKILTSLCCLDTFKKQFTFKTEAFLDRKNNLTIKGYGDPLFTSETIQTFCGTVATKLKQRQVTTLQSVIVDETFFLTPIKIPGTGSSTNPYDAPLSALSANFNTIFFSWSSKEQEFITAEPQTPLLPFAKKRIRASGRKSGRIILPGNEAAPYTGLLVKHFLESENILVLHSVKKGAVSNNDSKLVSVYSDHRLPDIIKKLLKHSNNFIANQLVMTLGAIAVSQPATLEKGITVLKNYAEKRLGIQAVTLVEGSGLSRRNRISAREMIKVLMGFKNHHRLLKKGYQDYYKTGTLNGINTRAGYLTGKNGRLHPYVILSTLSRSRVDRVKNSLLERVIQE